MKLKPLGARVAVQYKKLEQKKGGLIIPNESPPQFAEIVACGDLAHPMKVGDMVTLGRYVGHEVEHDGQKYIIVETKDIIGMLEKSNEN